MRGAPVQTEAVERWFISQGIPHFIAGYSATRDVFTRALPALILVLLAETIGAVNLDWPVWANAAALAGGFAILVAAWALANRLRGRPALARPERVGPPELAVFVLAPALLPLTFGGHVRAAAVTAAGNLVLLGVIYLATSYGLLPMTRWALRQLAGQLGAVFGLLARALPLLLVFVTFLFVNAEVWAVAGRLDGPFFWAVVGLFVAVGTAFVAARLPREVGQLAAFADTAELRRAVAGTPAEALTGHAAPAGGDGLVPRPLTWRQWGNVGLVLLFTQGLQVLLVAVMIGVFFVVFGLLVMTPDLIESWTGAPLGEAIVSFSLWGRTVPVTTELLRVAGFLGAFSGLYFAVYGTTDATYRREFFNDVVTDLRTAFAVRAVYLAALGARPAPSMSAVSPRREDPVGRQS